MSSGYVQNLNNRFQKQGIDVAKIAYAVESNANGTAHTATLTLSNYSPAKVFEGNGSSKQVAKEEAAKKALAALG